MDTAEKQLEWIQRAEALHNEIAQQYPEASEIQTQQASVISTQSDRQGSTNSRIQQTAYEQPASSQSKLPRLMAPEFDEPGYSHTSPYDVQRSDRSARYSTANRLQRGTVRANQPSRVSQSEIQQSQYSPYQRTLPSQASPNGIRSTRGPVQPRIAFQDPKPATTQTPVVTPAPAAEPEEEDAGFSMEGSVFKWKAADVRVPDRPTRANPKYDFLFTDIDRYSDEVVNVKPGDPDARPVTLPEVILHTLEKNPYILVAQFRPGREAFEQEIERSQFDPVFKIGGQWGRSDTLIGSVLDGQGVGTGSVANDSFGVASGLTDTISLAQKFTTGGVADIGWTTEYKFADPAGNLLTLNPQQNSALNLRFNQPLFQGAGNRHNGLTIEIAEVNYHGTFFTFEAKVNDILKNVVLDYWELYAAYSDVRKYEQAVVEAKTTWRKEIQKRDLGASSLPDVAQARENYEYNRHDLASSRRRFVTYELRLRERMGLPPHDGKTLVPTTVPVFDLTVPDWDSSLEKAMLTRPEILAQKKLVEVKELEYEFKENGLCPDINVYATYALTGLGDNFHDSAGGVLDNESTSWTMGFSYERPIHKRKAESELDKKLVELLQEKAVLRQIEFSVTHELRSIYAEITTARDMFEALDRRLKAAEVRKELSKVLYEQGKMSLDMYLRIQSSFVHTTLDRDEAYVKFNQALSNWEYAKGTILANANIHIRENESNTTPKWCE